MMSIARCQQRHFGTALKLSLMDKFTRVDSKLDPATKLMTMQINLASTAALSFTKDTSLSTIKEKLLASGASSVDFFTIKGAVVPLCERVGDL
jgi:hypothetical protein